MSNLKVLLSPSSFGQCGEEPFQILKENGLDVVINPFGRKLTEDEVIESASDCSGIVAGVEPLTKRVMDALPKLKCISRVGVGMDSVDLDYAKEKGIIVKNTPDGPSRSVAELTLALVMALLRKVPIADSNIRKGVWKKEIGNLLFKKKVGIYGLGRIGKISAKMFLSLGNEVSAYDIVKDDKWLESNDIKMVDQTTLFKDSDIIILHIPRINKDKADIDESLLRLIRPTSFLINVARGGVVDEDYLYEILKNNKIAGAAIDVFNEEPYFGQFTKLENTILTPHLGSYALEGKLQMEIDAVKNLLSVLN